jgi:hypothetical protein
MAEITSTQAAVNRPELKRFSRTADKETCTWGLGEIQFFAVKEQHVTNSHKPAPQFLGTLQETELKQRVYPSTNE